MHEDDELVYRLHVQFSAFNELVMKLKYVCLMHVMRDFLMPYGTQRKYLNRFEKYQNRWLGMDGNNFGNMLSLHSLIVYSTTLQLFSLCTMAIHIITNG